MNVRVRLSPSPTGKLHIGTARTALFNWLFARQNAGTFIVRVEDTDRERSRPEYETNIIDLLRWLGLTWDEGPDCGGPYAPYRQSERVELYRDALEQLRKTDRIYPCFCTPEQLEKERTIAQQEKRPPRYSGRCRAVSAAERNARLGAGERAVWRFLLPEQTSDVAWDDMIRGRVVVKSTELDDFIIARSLESALYNFAVVVDDAAMKISHVIRGEDHISNTPKQLLIQDALGYPHPEYGHLPLILNPDRTKMSKRTGNVDLDFYRQAGYLPEAMVNFFALLGWNPGDDREIFSREMLTAEFSLQRIHKSGAVFGLQKLQWVNQEYIRALPLPTLLDRLEPHIPELHRNDPRNSDIVSIVKDRMAVLSDFWKLAEFFYIAPTEYPAERLIWKYKPDTGPESRPKTRESLAQLHDWFQTQSFVWGAMMLEAAVKEWIAKEGRSVGETLWPMRVALSGEAASPGPFEIAGILGKEETLKRLQTAVQKLS